ncbi:HAMP domain-containing sensor histidine kinase [Novosphingobium sp. AAP93]|uniref:sensor histidine kinase n=1 Tax=Novosphingobium sp. AAP93 TaxID=1523427 RepID=UPI0006B9340F|nr:ATP-binding protein [Novosphingobium sp. AAP93]KPF89154.1 histidine kinase [Novosphingobium sp. AAP93]
MAESPARFRLWPRSLQGQMLLAIALALMVAQGLSAALMWRMQHERHFAGIVNYAAFSLLGRHPRAQFGPPPPPMGEEPEIGFRMPRPLRVQEELRAPQMAGDRRRPEIEDALRQVLEAQGVDAKQLFVAERDPARDPVITEWLARRGPRLRPPGQPRPRLIVAAIGRTDGSWLTARLLAPRTERAMLTTLIVQTLFIYLVLVGTVALILRRIARPLKALTAQVEGFARSRTAAGQLAPEGPDDIRRLIVAHNAMERRVGALLDEKDVMLGAIGHDLKTPLAALRVRIEAVEDDTERSRMAATIEDINRSLDDILSLARVGSPSDPLEQTELSALVADVVGEYEDMGEDVTLGEADRMVMPLRATWLRRALRNLVSNALRYGIRARVTLRREGGEAVLTVEDDGPGIPEHEIARMLEPFTRLEASRNSATGGAGLGLTLARAIADQHGGALILANRREGGETKGLTATLRLPLT